MLHLDRSTFCSLNLSDQRFHDGLSQILGLNIYHSQAGFVAKNGESTIVRAHGANDELQPSVVADNASCFESAQFCLISTEIPWELAAPIP